MTGVLVLIVVALLLATRTRRSRRRLAGVLSTLWLVLVWACTLLLPHSRKRPGKPVRTSTRPRAAGPAPVVTRKRRTWPAPPWRPARPDPSAPRPGQGPRYFTHEQKTVLLERAGYRCQHVSKLGFRCPSMTNLRADHRHPYSWGGKTILENGQILCDPHNVEKGAHWTDVHDPAELERVCVPHMLPRNRFGWGR
jgi:hypothetical protein